MSNVHWAKQFYLSLFPIYPIGSLIVQGVRGDTFFQRRYTNAVEYPISDDDINLLEEELIKLNDRLDEKDSLNDVKFTLSTSDQVSEEVYGILAFRMGADFQFPTRMLIRSVDEFRSRISDIVYGATGQRIEPDSTSKISDKVIESILLNESARRFLFQRSLTKSISYGTFTSRYAYWCLCVGVSYGAFVVLFKYVNPVVALFAASALAISSFLMLSRFTLAPQDFEFDRRVYRIDDSYAKGCAEFLTACVNFGLLMNRLAKQERGRPFTADGNPTDGHAPYTTRWEYLKRYMDEKEQHEKTKKLRLLDQ